MSAPPPLVWVVGDAMADVTVSSSRFRRTPEDPTVLALPAPRPDDPAYPPTPGGAANVAANLRAMGCVVTLFAAADDRAGFGQGLVAALDAAGVSFVRVSPAGRPAAGTTARVRFVEAGRLVGRVDHDYDAPGPVLPPPADPPSPPAAVVLCDHGRGVVTRDSARAWVRWAHARRVPVYADPKVGRQDVWDGTPVDYMVANWAEACGSRGGIPDVDPADDGWALAVAGSCRAAWGPFRAAVVKRGPHGSAWVDRGHDAGPAAGVVPPVDPQRVYDVQGAGDTYLAGLVVARCRGAALPDACLYASAAAGVAVGRPGTAVVTAAEAAAAVRPVVAAPRGVVSPAEAAALAARLAGLGLRVGMTTGCFRVLTPGHAAFVREAARRCDFFVAAVDGDARVRALKGAEVVGEADRAAVVAGLAGVGAAFVFDTDPAAVVSALRPAVMFKGAEYAGREVAGAALLGTWGGRLELLPMAPGPHAADVITRVRELPR